MGKKARAGGQNGNGKANGAGYSGSHHNNGNGAHNHYDENNNAKYNIYGEILDDDEDLRVTGPDDDNNFNIRSRSDEHAFQFLRALEVFNLLQHNAQPIIIDIRSQAQYEQLSISKAINIHFDETVKTPKDVEKRISDNLWRTLWERRSSQKVLLYDDSSEDETTLSDVMKMAFHLAHEKGRSTTVYILKGGIMGFYKNYPFFCEGKSIVRSAKTICTPRKFPSHILPFVFLGKYDHAREKQVLLQLQVTHILNVTEECENKFESDSDGLRIKYFKIPVKDELDARLSDYFDAAFQFIDDARDSAGKCLVHCAQGKSRSVAIVVAYIMKTYKYSLDDAINHVKTMRPTVQPNSSFMEQLRQYELEALYE